jgi:hypothetical protein
MNEIDILIDDDHISGDDYVFLNDISEDERSSLIIEFKKMILERENDLKKSKKEKRSILFDPKNLDLEVNKNG